MGIPKFFGWFANQEIFKPTISRNRPLNVDIFAIDGNALIHNNVNKIMLDPVNPITTEQELNRRRHEVFQGFFQDVIGLTQMINPKRSLFLHIDGVAPQAKINQQRNRRYKAASERKPSDVFDRNAITPGTEFMEDLHKYILTQLERVKRLDQNPPPVPDLYTQVLPPHIVYSSYLVPGEGEHKISDQLRTIVSTNQTVVIHGADADLMMIYLMHLRNGWENIYLFRENNQNYAIEIMVDLRAVERVIKQLFPNVFAPLDDFVVILFLIGNDFLPHFPLFERIYDALNTLIGGYAHFISITGNKGITTGSSIDWKNYSKYLEYITINYNDILLKNWSENKDAQIKFPSLIAERCIVQTQQIIGTQPQCIRSLDISRFTTEWYRFVFSPKTGKGSIEPTPQDIDDMIKYYLEGIAWVFNYYRYGVARINIGWYYPYHYAPIFSEIYQYINRAYNNGTDAMWENSPLHIYSEFATPYEQLLMVIPPKSLLLVPAPLRSLLGENSPIYDLFPESFLLDNQGKMEEWQSIAILPMPNITRVIHAIISLNLPISFFAKYNPTEPYVMVRNIMESFRIHNIRGRGARGTGFRGRIRGRRGRGFRGRGINPSVQPTFSTNTTEYRRTFI